MPEQKIIKCPFCKEGDIQTTFTPSVMVTKYAHASSNRKVISYMKPEKYEIITDKCPVCEKCKKDIKDALEHGVAPSKQSVIERMRAMGVDPSKGFVQKKQKGKFD